MFTGNSNYGFNRPTFPILTTLLLMQSGYRHVPYSSLERIVEQNKDGYYRALRASQNQIWSEGENLDDWMRFFLTSLKKQKDVLLGKIEREQLLKKLAPLAEKILAMTRERGRVTIADAVTLLAANRNTVKLVSGVNGGRCCLIALSRRAGLVPSPDNLVLICPT
ncbi:hypothetical protein [Geopsychrobacter electrodiphilus]|uniref:hypothetical protein n=1 Tax=Geopsychrobacter electrodiphilus TaxID=225196 RepID=UPI0003A61A5A|nr:hypothetical protein [Geopsychrobacter electrodiphilus]